mmetsp:Transcript_31397/g.34752  ORF Transcript_31397/g.34752 Transcript_31397/m.34752 type:complete len:265 (+) Transcript_31397:58-852(+)
MFSIIFGAIWNFFSILLLFTCSYYPKHLVFCFVIPNSKNPQRQRTSASPVFSSDPKTVATITNSLPVEEFTSYINPSITSSTARKFSWWNVHCDNYLDNIEKAGGERFIAFPDKKGKEGEESETHNWLHVTSSSPERRGQYEMRYIKNNQLLAGIVRFGIDCEGPPGCVHGGAMATVADAVTATVVFKASDRWGLTTRLDCNYREMLPLETPVNVEAKVVQLKKRKATVEWKISSLTEVDKKKNEPVKYSFGSADFLLPREIKS